VGGDGAPGASGRRCHSERLNWVGVGRVGHQDADAQGPVGQLGLERSEQPPSLAGSGGPLLARIPDVVQRRQDRPVRGHAGQDLDPQRAMTPRSRS
jgi:hypothetical protein